jgi:hypothetical protein
MSASAHRWIIGAGLLAALTNCTPIIQEDLPSGDHLVKTYSRLFGIAGTRRDNQRLAEQTCPDGFILLDETFGVDSEGAFRRWEYGCLAPPLSGPSEDSS